MPTPNVDPTLPWSVYSTITHDLNFFALTWFRTSSGRLLAGGRNFVAGSAQIMRSSADHTTWATVLDVVGGVSRGVHAIVELPSGRLVAMLQDGTGAPTLPNAFYVSDDDGATWVLLGTLTIGATNYMTFSNVGRQQLTAWSTTVWTVPAVVVPGAAPTVILRTADGGVTWAVAQTLFVGAVEFTDVPASLESGVGLTGVFDGANPNPSGLYRSPDVGATWTLVLNPDPVITQNYRGGFVRRASTGTVLVGGVSGAAAMVRRSLDAGLTWGAVIAPFGSYVSGFYDINAGQGVLATSANARLVYRSLDDGVTWGLVADLTPFALVSNLLGFLALPDRILLGNETRALYSSGLAFPSGGDSAGKRRGRRLGDFAVGQAAHGAIHSR